MTISAILEKTKIQKIGKTPVVVLPLNVWQELEVMLEEYQAGHSLNYVRSIKEARSQVKSGELYELDIQTGKFKKAKKIK
ncbi:MAG: hypothetical protein DDT19_02014 [Syntrophomonadaceae bacterium]|nr:hypothetical protein [Bacillota bacterium]